MPKVLIDAYINDNLGDDLFVQILCNRYKHVKFYIIARKQNKKMFKSIGNLKYLSFDTFLINKLHLTQFYKKVLRHRVNKKVNIHVTIGGSLFMERENCDINFEYKKFRNKIIKNKKNYLIGCNFGEYSSKKFYENYLNAFSLYDNICFRDNYSFNLFKNSLNNVSVAPDIAFQLEYLAKDIMDKGYVLISVINFEERPSIKEQEENYIVFLISQIKKFVKLKFRIILFAACNPEGDTLIIKKIMTKLSYQEKHVIEIKIHNNLDYSIKLIAESSIVISTRLHVTILALLFNKKTLPIVYDNKIINVLKDFNYNGDYIDIRNFKNIKTCSPKAFNISNVIRNNSRNQFLSLDIVLMDKK